MNPGQRTWRGLTIGEGPYHILQEEGLDDLVVRSATSALPRYHGSIPGDHTADMKRIVLALWWQDDDLAVAEALGVDIRAAFQVSRSEQFPYGFQEAGQPEGLVMARVLRRSQPRHLGTEALGLFRMLVELEVTDPVLYSAGLLGATMEPYAPGGGFDWDTASWPLSWGSSGSGGGVLLENEGEWETWPIFTINGPSSGTLTNPIIENVTTGQRLALNANGGVSINAGEELTVSTHPGNRYVRFSTGASRYGKLSTDSEFFPLLAGSNELRFRASGSIAGSNVEVSARSAWL